MEIQSVKKQNVDILIDFNTDSLVLELKKRNLIKKGNAIHDDANINVLSVFSIDEIVLELMKKEMTQQDYTRDQLKNMTTKLDGRYRIFYNNGYVIRKKDPKF